MLPQPLLLAVGRFDLPPLPVHPRRLVRPTWRAADRSRIARYLRDGAILFRGYPPPCCRFGCIPPDEDGLCPEMGGRYRTDGVWLWPEGLAHYVERHAVRLPDEFVRTMEGFGWEPPPRPQFPPATRAALASGGTFLNVWFWEWWAWRHAGPVFWW